MSRLPSAARMMFRPIRPKPLIPTLMPMEASGGALRRRVMERKVHALQNITF
jgi:hypothetical protein